MNEGLCKGKLTGAELYQFGAGRGRENSAEVTFVTACGLVVSGQWPEAQPVRQAERGERMQPTAQAVGGMRKGIKPQRRRKRERVTHIRQHLAASDFFHALG